VTPGARIIHPEFGDCTADIIEELLAMAELQNPVILEREQASIAAASGQVARDLCCGRVVAEIHPEVFEEWVQKEGPEFFSKKHGGDGVEYLAKHFPATRVKSVSPNVRLHVNRSPVTPRRGVHGKRGRWAA
jgi:hypothetical protein